MVRRRDCRSHCPINFALEIFGDPWSLLVVRDVVFFGKKTFREFQGSGERIASNVLADRLRRLGAAGILRKEKGKDEDADGRQVIYRITEKGLDLLPVLLDIIEWSAHHDPETAAPAAFIRRLRKDRRSLIREIRSGRWRPPQGAR